MKLASCLVPRSLWLAIVSARILCFDAMAQLRFDPISLEANQPRLNLRGIPGDSITLESSFDLFNWDVLYSGIATNGQLKFQDSSVSNVPRKFYRAYAVIPTNPPGRVVVPVLDPSKTASTLAAPVVSRCDLALGNTALITLTVRSNIITEVDQVLLTHVTSISGLPFAHGLIMAAQIDAANPALVGATELVITFGKDMVKDRRQVVSFACDADGSHFRLIPDRVTRASATIAPTRPGVYGCSIATRTELDQLAKPASTAGSPISASRVQLASSSDDGSGSWLLASRSCFPERVQAAIAIRDQLRSEVDQITERMALARVVVRQNQPDSDGDDLLPVDELGREACTFYQEKIRPLFPRVKDNCSLLKVLAGTVLGIERQILLLGYGDCVSFLTLRDLPICDGSRACFEEIKKCCEEKPEQRERLAPEIVGILRQQAILGLEGEPGCVTYAEALQAIEDCTNYDWAGTMSITEKGGFLKAVGPGLAIGVRYMTWDGVVTAQSSDGGILTLSGPLAFIETEVAVIPNVCCGPYINVDESISKTNLSINLNLSILGSGEDASYSMKYAGLHQGPGKTSKFGIQYLDCKTCREFTYYEAVSFTPLLEHILRFSRGGEVTATNSVQGTVELNGVFQGNPTDIKYTWNLVKRRRGGN